MKKFQTKITILAIVILIITFILPMQSLGKDDNLQIIETDNGDYIVYIKDMLDEKFDFTITQNSDTKEIDLNYQKSLQDDDLNEVVFITKEEYDEISKKDNYLYVKKDGETLISGQKLNFDLAFSKSKMEYVEKTMKVEEEKQRIKTEFVTDIIEKDEIVDEVKIKTTVGGLKVEEDENSKYYYSITKLPANEYNNLKELVDKISKDYENINMYSKIELAKEFYELYYKLADNQEWNEIENSVIMQPNDAKKDEQYVVYLKEINQDGEETLDLRIMTSYREDEEEKIPARTENKIVKETTKLPITGDSLILFVILAVILFVAIIVFVRMKKLQKEQK